MSCAEDQPPTSPRAISLAHSPLLAAAAGAPAGEAAAASGPRSKEVLDARRRFSTTLESDVLDYLHFHPSQLEDCVATLATIFGNVLAHPDDPKYRRVKAANKAFLKHVAAIPRSEGLLLQAGWRPRVVDMEKSWLFEHPPDSAEFRLLGELAEVLQKAVAALHAKAERKRKEEEERKSKHADERGRIRLALEDDRRQRHVAEELTRARPAGAAAGPGPSSPRAPE